MSRFCVSNNQEWNASLEREFISCGFRKSGEYRDSIFLDVYKKFNINNCNYFSDSDDFVSSSGTLFYREKFGEEALKLMLSDIRKKHSVKDIRRQCVGTYAVIIKVQNHLIIFVDETGNYGLYYFNKYGKYIVTNTYYHIQKCVKEALNKYALIEEISEYCILDNCTPFNNIYRVMNDEVIKIDLLSCSFQITRVDLNYYSISFDSIEDAAERISERIKYYSSFQKFYNDKLIVFMTGGMDSRVTLASDMSVGISPVLCNWQGSPELMNTKIEDRDITELICKELCLESCYFNVSNGEIREDDFDFVRCGELARIYGGNKKWHAFFKRCDYSCFDFGYFGETIKGWDPLDANYSFPMTLQKYVSLYVSRQRHDYTNFNDCTIRDYNGYIFCKLKEVCEKYSLDTDNLNKEDCMFLYYIYRTHADTKACNYANIFGYSYNIYAQKQLIDYINQIPYEYKINGRLNILITKKLLPKLIEIPYFSHTHFIKLNNDSKEFVSGKNKYHMKSIKQKIGSIIGEKKRRRIKNLLKPKEFAVAEEYTKKCIKLNMEDFMPVTIDKYTFNDKTDYLSYWSTLCLIREVNSKQSM